jgi:hypothetical protein
MGIFLFTTASRTALGPTQPPIKWVPGVLSLRVKRPGREADHSPPSSAEVKEYVELYFHSPNTPSWRGAQLKHRDNFTHYVGSSVHREGLAKASSETSSVVGALWRTPWARGSGRLVCFHVTHCSVGNFTKVVRPWDVINYVIKSRRVGGR